MRPDTLQVLHEVAVATGGVREPVELARLVSEQASALLGAEGVAFRLWNSESGTLERLYANDHFTVAREHVSEGGDGTSARAFAERQPVVVQDYGAWEGHLPEAHARGIRAAVAVPLLVRDQAIGTLALRFYHPYYCTDEDIQTLTLLAAQVAPAIQAAKLSTEHERTAERLAALLRIVRRFAAETDEQLLMDHLIEEGALAGGGDGCSVRRWDEASQMLVRVRNSLPQPFLGGPIRLGEGASGRAAEQRAPVVVQDYAREFPGRDSGVARATAVIALPLLHEGRLLGSISVISRQPGKRFVEADVDALEIVAGVASAVLAGLERTHLLQIEAETDALTRVANRRKAAERLTQLVRLSGRQAQPFALAILDLDRFKDVNDAHGHAAGDAVLQRLGEMLATAFRGEDVVGRWGGEEFVVGLYGMSKEQAVARLLDLQERVRKERFSGRDGASFSVAFSAGVAEAPADGQGVETLCEAADRALYAAKAAGRARVFPASGAPTAAASAS